MHAIHEINTHADDKNHRDESQKIRILSKQSESGAGIGMEGEADDAGNKRIAFANREIMLDEKLGCLVQKNDQAQDEETQGSIRRSIDALSSPFPALPDKRCSVQCKALPLAAVLLLLCDR